MYDDEKVLVLSMGKFYERIPVGNVRLGDLTDAQLQRAVDSEGLYAFFSQRILQKREVEKEMNKDVSTK